MSGTGDIADVIIVGGGVIGLSVGCRLLADGLNVAIIDAGAAAPSATLVAAGMLAPSFEKTAGSEPEVFYRFCADGLAQWPDFAAALEAKTGLDVDFRNDGILGVAFNDDEAERLKSDFSELRSREGKAAWLSGKEALELEPVLSENIEAALFAPDNGQVDPRRLLPALKAAFKMDGGDYVAGEKITDITYDGAQVSGVATEKDALYSAPIVVIASGAFVGSLDFGKASDAIFPVKGEAYDCVANDKGPARVIRSEGAYLCPKMDGRLYVGATEIVGDIDMAPSDAGIAELKSNAARAAPAVSGFRETDRWAGLRPATADGAPILGQYEHGPDGLIFALGHYRNGILLAPPTAAALSALIRSGESPEIVQKYGPDRFND